MLCTVLTCGFKTITNHCYLVYIITNYNIYIVYFYYHYAQNN